MTNAELLAQRLRENEASFRCEAAMEIPNAASFNARYAAMLFDVADYLEMLCDDDPRIIQMERAGYFVRGVSGVSVPGEAGEAYIQEGKSEDEVDGPDGFLTALAEAAILDEQALHRQAAK